MKLLIFLIGILFLTSCDYDSSNSDIELSNFIKPEFSLKESSFNCNIVDGKTLNSVEKFIPRFVNSFSQMKGGSDELFFLFPVYEDETETQYFEILLRHQELASLKNFNLTIAALDFDEIAKCESLSQSSNSLSLTNINIMDSPVIAEILECEYIEENNYATIKLVFERFTDALIKNNAPVNIFFSDKINIKRGFQWTNIFASLKSRKEFVESWQKLDISKEIQSLLLEQSICQSSKIFLRYKIL